eukprot:CAMPEP_0194046836 /NCGR_PEP_ID=MMETSP0009_2-20130614/22550_1 /TAXON_ID=210454 /ORGANISM="Grammatophora oceanica, Strain CCMP 410" /LENGTH=201 /DNA_ID=CAMNT_0038692273 /DNA_START=78 /DNA_END=683 /DNA_ORIENTATION=+
MKTVLAAIFVASAAAFAPAKQSKTSTSACSASMSRSLPFLLEPPNLKGYVGAEAGFDPLGFSDYFDMKWLRESEIKHGRVAMLATVGYVLQEYWTIPGLTPCPDPNDAPTAVGIGSMLQIVFWGGVLEFWTNKGQVTMMDMFTDGDRVPGKLGFDPMGLAVGKSQDELDLIQYKEIKNGRLAMLAIGGMIHHNWITGETLF